MVWLPAPIAVMRRRLADLDGAQSVGLRGRRGVGIAIAFLIVRSESLVLRHTSLREKTLSVSSIGCPFVYLVQGARLICA
jgi:hypothetical protein